MSLMRYNDLFMKSMSLGGGNRPRPGSLRTISVKSPHRASARQLLCFLLATGNREKAQVLHG